MRSQPVATRSTCSAADNPPTSLKWMHSGASGSKRSQPRQANWNTCSATMSRPQAAAAFARPSRVSSEENSVGISVPITSPSPWAGKALSSVCSMHSADALPTDNKRKSCCRWCPNTSATRINLSAVHSFAASSHASNSPASTSSNTASISII